MASSSQEIVFITGANTGIGFQIVSQLLRDHGDRFYVFVGSRTLSKGEAAVQKLHAEGSKNCEAVQIDVTDNSSITRVAKTVEAKFGRVDVLHINAGIAHPDMHNQKAGQDRRPISATIMETMHTNVAGAAETAETFIPLLQRAENPRIVFMSTSLGSLTMNHTIPGMNALWPAYSASKAALNMIMLYYWGRYGKEMRINACSPGLRATALNDFGTAGVPSWLKAGGVEGGARNAIRLTLLGKDGESGTHTHWKDEEDKWENIPW
ncbi:hypothetical protein BAUCODRAFT_351380 [Baudoinia panamericana UAMH 10762]|uniref:Ketoreductase (KR) domain-containing protein n=1 Tax=Baudoinia panamericana (strain UAMH 10762) TaxID=717646 RepID=M2LYM4_BAUPA|nr:uncharacterized protein BAUCODRAFT_351380 [Baudoinia panamericana UAMH 10762]EMC99807.1 hypothetical protein BAUCODRAFT_351380 [Baudoinia panamericana UAMH 10762]